MENDRCPNTKRRKNGWHVDSPTPCHCEELFRQIGDGAISGARIQALLNGDDQLSFAHYARSLLCDDFITHNEIAHCCDEMTYRSDAALDFTSAFPGSKIIEFCSLKGYILVAGPPRTMSLGDIAKLNKDICNIETVANEKKLLASTVKPTWLAVSKKILACSTYESWKSQTFLLSGSMRVPEAAEVMWAFTTYMKVRKKQLLPNHLGRVKTVGSDGNHLRCGCKDGIFEITRHGNKEKCYNTGVLTAVKF